MRYTFAAIFCLILNASFTVDTGGEGDEKGDKKSTTHVLGKAAVTEKAPHVLGSVLSSTITPIDACEVPELTVENLQKELEALDVASADIVLRQAILETGWFKCQNCSLGSNNLFGFLYRGRYLSFDNWVESVMYYKWWQDKLYKGGDYYAFLKQVGYATSPNYISYLKKLEGQY